MILCYFLHNFIKKLKLHYLFVNLFIILKCAHVTLPKTNKEFFFHNCDKISIIGKLI